MKRIKFYPEWEKAFFIKRLNRFVMVLEKEGGRIKAYIANPGRMEEYLVLGHPFFIIPTRRGKYSYRVVSTMYEGSHVLLDTSKVNDIVRRMLRQNTIPEIGGIESIRPEVTLKRSRFDFLIERRETKPAILEVKSCSLCHAGVAMFPDAPTERGKRHLEELEFLGQQGYDVFNLYLVTNRCAEVFLPNCHSDPEYGQAFNRVETVRFLTYRVEMPDPVTVDISRSSRIDIDFEKSREMCRDGGSYLLVMSNEQAFRKEIGALGTREFKKGYFVYVGSALTGLDRRIKRHLRKKKKIHWHIDYVLPGHMKKEKIYKILTTRRIETRLARELHRIGPGYVPGFGSSDTGEPSHLFYFPENPVGRRDFLNLLLDFRMFIKN